MADLKTVGIKELKNNLSAYLREVRRGTRILVSDRSRIVAELHEPGASYVVGDGPESVLETVLADGRLSMPTQPKVPLPVSTVKVERGTSRRLLDEVRGERAT